jgi:hypothetical protein
MYRTTRRLAVVALLVALCTIPTVFSYAQGPGLMETFDDATLPGWDHSDDVAVVDGALRVPAPGFAFYHAYGSKINLRKKSALQMGHGATGKTPQDTVSKVKSQEPLTQADGRKLDQNHAL